MRLHAVFGDAELVRDLAISATAANESEYLLLSLCEPVGSRADRHAPSLKVGTRKTIPPTGNQPPYLLHVRARSFAHFHSVASQRHAVGPCAGHRASLSLRT